MRSNFAHTYTQAHIEQWKNGTASRLKCAAKVENCLSALHHGVIVCEHLLTNLLNFFLSIEND